MITSFLFIYHTLISITHPTHRHIHSPLHTLLIQTNTTTKTTQQNNLIVLKRQPFSSSTSHLPKTHIKELSTCFEEETHITEDEDSERLRETESLLGYPSPGSPVPHQQQQQQFAVSSDGLTEATMVDMGDEYEEEDEEGLTGKERMLRMMMNNNGGKMMTAITTTPITTAAATTITTTAIDSSLSSSLSVSTGRHLWITRVKSFLESTPHLHSFGQPHRDSSSR